MQSKLLGTWKLKHCKLFNTNGVEQHDPFHNASGILIYSAEGIMSAQLMKQGHPNEITNNVFEASTEVVKKLFENYIAYYGSYTINEKDSIVTHRVLGAQYPNMISQILPRRFEFKDNNTLVLSNVEPETIVNVEPVIRYLTWSRIHSATDFFLKLYKAMNKDLSTEQQLQKLEEQLLQPSTRKSAADVAALLADEFIEFGSLGRIYNKQQVIDGLLTESSINRTMIDFKTLLLAPDVALVTYKIIQPVCSLRSSIWKLIDNRWQLVFHQGTFCTEKTK